MLKSHFASRGPCVHATKRACGKFLCGADHFVSEMVATYRGMQGQSGGCVVVNGGCLCVVCCVVRQCLYSRVCVCVAHRTPVKHTHAPHNSDASQNTHTLLSPTHNNTQPQHTNTRTLNTHLTGRSPHSTTHMTHKNT